MVASGCLVVVFTRIRHHRTCTVSHQACKVMGGPRLTSGDNDGRLCADLGKKTGRQRREGEGEVDNDE